MNTKIFKAVAGVACLSTALAMTYRSNPKAADAEKKASAVKDADDLKITSPKKETDYGIGTYKVEGLVPKNGDVTLYVDRKEFKAIKANSEDGSYLEEIPIQEAGKHVIVAEYKNSKGEKTLRKLEFKASSKKNPASSGTDLVEDKQDDSKDISDTTSDSDDSNSLLPVNPNKEVIKYPEDPKDPNSASKRAENGVREVKTSIKPADKKSAAASKAAKVGFVISSYANFNVVPHGIVNIGGKGMAGDKVLLMVDGKPSMKGTIKPDGRWKFPVKIASAGFRSITAKNLRTNEKSTVKLKIK